MPVDAERIRQRKRRLPPGMLAGQLGGLPESVLCVRPVPQIAFEIGDLRGSPIYQSSDNVVGPKQWRRPPG